MQEPSSQDSPYSHPHGQQSGDTTPLQAAAGVARIAATAWYRTAEWSIRTSTRAGARVIHAALSGQQPAELFQATGAELRDHARRLLDVAEPQQGWQPGGPAAGGSGDNPDERSDPATLPSLRARGAELLDRSADVAASEDTHPAYARILEELAPDEARILRLLALTGPHPAVDVRSRRTLHPRAELVAEHLSMVGAYAGCRRIDRVPAYLNNLDRLQLVRLSGEALRDPHAYQVLEAQPHVVASMKVTGYTFTVRRAIHLTPFGRDFCHTCLPLYDTLPTTPGDIAPPDE